MLLTGNSLVISELLASNSSVLADEDGDFSDWLEICNPTGAAIDLDGWYLTDDAGDLTKWEFPSRVLQPDAYLVVFASAKDRADPGAPLHTNFRLGSEGEYLALVQSDGTTIAHEFAPAYPEQYADVSYGFAQSTIPYVVEGAELAYLVPSVSEAGLGTTWTQPGFGDGSWNGNSMSSRILITEVGTTSPDFIEIQNVSDKTVDTSGWVVALQHGVSVSINNVHPILWHLPDSMEPGEILHRNDSTWGSDIVWASTGPNWAMIIDDEGNVVDFIPWKYQTADLAALDVTINGFPITVGGAWSGVSFNPLGIEVGKSFQRQGSSDGNTAADWAVAPVTTGTPNAGLTTPFLPTVFTGIGYSTTSPGLDEAIRTDVTAAMHNISASLWTRIRFQVADPTASQGLILQMKYNDGFVAYLNGQRIAGRNAPASPQWNSTATAAHGLAQSLVYEEIDVSQFLGQLRAGDNVLAVHGLNANKSDGNFLISPRLVGVEEFALQRYFAQPTPGGPNAFGLQDVVADTQFNIEHGFYSTPQLVSITTPTPGATIYYTLDGSKPTETRGIEYTGPIAVTGTTTLRAAAFRLDFIPSRIDTHTYFINESAAIRSLPAISLVGGENGTFGTENGLWADVQLRGPEAEFPVSFEVIYPEDNSGIQQNGGIRLQGSSYWREVLGENPDAKWSFRIYFRGEYDRESGLDYPLIEGSSVDRYKTVVLRGGYNDSSNPFIKDELGRRLHQDMGAVVSYGTFANLFINGQLKNNGYYNVVQRQDESMFQEKYGSDLPWDVVTEWQDSGPAEDPPRNHDEPYYFDVRDGDAVSFAELLDYALASDLSQDVYYQEICRRLDVPQFVDYLILQGYAAIRDWPQNNWNAARERSDGELGQWRFYAWDLEFGWGSQELTGSFKTPGGGSDLPIDILYDNLRVNDEFRQLFADRAGEHFFNGGALTEGNVVARFEELRAEMAGVLPDMDTYIRDTFAPQRVANVLVSMTAQGLFTFEGPRFRVNGSPQHGGQVDTDDAVSLENPNPSGAIYYTLDGSDPRLPGGQPSPAARVYTTAEILGQSTLIKSRVLSGGTWSALSEAQFYVGQPATAGYLAPTELNYHPYDPTPAELAVNPEWTSDDFEFLELKNVSPAEAIDLTGVTFTDGIAFSFGCDASSRLEPGQFAVVAKNLDAFRLRYGDEITVAGTYDGTLDDGGERLTLVDRLGNTIRSFRYDDSGPWPGRADGGGSSLEVKSTNADYDDDDSWRSSSEFGGSPGRDGSGPVPDVVVNEVLSDPVPGGLDAIELYNTTGQTIDLSGWFLSDSGGNYKKVKIPAGTSIPGGGYRVFDANALGFALDRDGEDIWLLEADAAGNPTRFADHVEFGEALEGVSFGRWPNGDGELVMMAGLTLGSENLAPRAGMIVINEIHTDPMVKTELVEFVELHNVANQPVDLSGWYFDRGITYTFPAGTTLPAGGYLVITQDMADFRAEYGFDARGQFEGKLSNDGETLTLRDAARVKQDEVSYQLGYPWPTVGEPRSVNDPLDYSLQLIHPAMDNDLGGNWRSTVPTPRARNSVFSANAAPQTRQVEHSPKQPVAGQDVTVTVKATDPDGVHSVSLAYQLVNPGDYIEIGDSRYNNASYWTTVAMFDDGTGGDAVPGDDVYTAVLPGTLQTHRRLVRYRITAADSTGALITVPYADDPCPNFVYYVYDGMPSWTGAVRPGITTAVTFEPEVLESMAVYQLITTRKDHEESQYIPNSTAGKDNSNLYRYQGTLVYNGEVYDHIRYRPRGGVHRFKMGKNMWKFDFNRGHYFQAHDDYGNPYDVKWDKMNFSAIIQQGNFGQRGEQGLFEWAGFKLHNLAGNMASNSNFVHFRIVENANENGPNQYSGDFQGMYLVIEQPDGQMLDQHDLPDGNFYKMEGSSGTLNNQGPTQPSNKSDLNAFINGYLNNPTAAWCEQNIDLENYYSFRAIAMAIHDYDIHAGKNYFYYHNPETGKWSIHNWDLDLTWTTTYGGGGGQDPLYDNSPYVHLLDIPELKIGYNNRLRELVDLLFNPEQTGMMLDEAAQFIYTPGEPSMVDADRMMWDYNPIMSSSYIDTSKTGPGWFYQASPTRDFAGMIQIEKNYVAARMSNINNVDPLIASDENLAPNTPTIGYVGQDGFPIDGLRFQTSSFSSSQGRSFAGMEWRIGRVTDPTSPDFDPWEPRHYEITATWESGELPSFHSTIDVPGDDLEIGATYRVRVRMKDDLGRYSHWSDPVQLIVADATSAVSDSLRITEINYNPYDPTAAELATQPAGDPDFTASDFEFVELKNVGAEPIADLAGVQFTEGITFDFTYSDVTSLAAGESLVIVKNPAAFAARYGTGVNGVADGGFGGQLGNGGERLTLIDRYGVTVLDFVYGDEGDGWPAWADGMGSSLELINPATAPSSYESADRWRSSRQYGGSPGVDANATQDVIVNEVLTHTDYPEVDAIELHNTTDQPVDVGGWYLSDEWGWASEPANGDYQKFRIPDGTVIPPGGYVTLYEGHYEGGLLVFNQAYEFGGDGSKDFALSAALGDTVWLMEAEPGGKLLRFADMVEFGAAANGESFGRWPDGGGELYPQIATSLDHENAGPRIGPVIVSEIMYHPVDGGDEYIELYNTGGAAVPFYDPANPANTWQFTSGVTYPFPEDVVLPAGATLLVVPIDPAVFRAKYAVPAGVQIFGPYLGALDNAGETLRLLWPDEPPTIGPDVVPYLLADEVRYDDGGSWPAEADGDGYSLHRLAADLWGNQGDSWQAADPTPGTVSLAPQPQVMGRWIFYNRSTFDGNDPAADARDDAAIAVDKTPLVPGDAITTATAANYTSFHRGINGIMIDVLDSAGAITAADFRFHVGNNNDPSTWTDAPPPESFTVRAGAGVGEPDRVTFTWADQSIRNQWLEVTVLAENLGLASDDVFYFGNAVAEAGNSPTDAQVTTIDLLLARNNPRSFLDPADAEFPYDYDRDGRVNTTDVLLARNNQTNFFTALRLIDVPSPGAGMLPLESPVPADPAELPGLSSAVHQDEPLEASAAVLAWLDQFEPPEDSSEKDNIAAPAVDALLATYWP
ncbi:MAG TPA: lamin tail domain-containing protein [Thermoguttaceae bacterium]|nr:lamin tail domain-containing protein [Thermoguttaceae bacterium]